MSAVLLWCLVGKSFSFPRPSNSLTSNAWVIVIFKKIFYHKDFLQKIWGSVRITQWWLVITHAIPECWLIFAASHCPLPLQFFCCPHSPKIVYHPKNILHAPKDLAAPPQYIFAVNKNFLPPQKKFPSLNFVTPPKKFCQPPKFLDVPKFFDTPQHFGMSSKILSLPKVIFAAHKNVFVTPASSQILPPLLPEIAYISDMVTF